MRDGVALNLIYQFSHDSSGEFPELTGRYRVLYFFSESGPVPHDAQKEIFQKMTNKSADSVLDFNSLEDLKEFSLAVCQKLRAPEVFILSTQDYNVGVEAARDVRAFREIYRRYGLNLVNTEVINRTPRMFSKLFGTHKK